MNSNTLSHALPDVKFKTLSLELPGYENAFMALRAGFILNGQSNQEYDTEKENLFEKNVYCIVKPTEALNSQSQNPGGYYKIYYDFNNDLININIQTENNIKSAFLLLNNMFEIPFVRGENNTWSIVFCDDKNEIYSVKRPTLPTSKINMINVIIIPDNETFPGEVKCWAQCNKFSL